MPTDAIAKFAKAVAHGFDPSCQGVQMPTDSPCMTWPYKMFLKTDIATDANGSCVVAFNPSWASDAISVWATNGSTTEDPVINGTDVSVVNYSLSTIAVTHQDTGWTRYGLGGSPFGMGYAFSIPGLEPTVMNVNQTECPWAPPGLRARLVTGALSVQFQGSSLNDGGIYYSMVDPSHENMVGLDIASYLSKFTCTKYQPLHAREVITLNLMCCTRDQQELSPKYDSIKTQSPISLNGAAILHPGLVPISHNGFVPFPAGASKATSRFDVQQELRSIITQIWPFSRDNALTYAQREWAADETTAVGHTCTWDANGLVTWSANTPSIENSTIWRGHASGSGNYSLFVYYDPNWYICDDEGFPFTFANAVATTFYFSAWVAIPPIPAAMIIKAGAGNANQPLHMEVAVHAELSGYFNQGRTTMVVPCQAAVAIAQTGLMHAREIVANHPHASVADLIHHGIQAAAKVVAPQLGAFMATQCFGAGAGPIGARLGKRLASVL